MTINATTKIMAFFCAVCPFCIVARKCPESVYARALKKMEKMCPACKAYRKIKSSRRFDS